MTSDARSITEEFDVPPSSVLDRQVIDAAYFRDIYRVPLHDPGAGVVDLFFGIFGHHPLWMKVALIVRNRLAALCGLEVPTVSDILHPQIKSSYRVGDKIGPWPIFFLSDTELVAGQDNKHLDFRLSVLKVTEGEAASVLVSTLCTVHNASGKVYLFFIIPFHKWGVRRLLSSALQTGRL